MAVIVSAHQMQKSFATRTLFRKLSFAIESESRIGLIGPNGAGKSTLLKLIAGLDVPDGGELTLSRGLRVGYLAQTPTFKEGATIEQSIVEGLSEDEQFEALARVEEWMSRLDLNIDGRTAETPIAELSGGWQKRVALARELVRLPDLLLLDEPTNHLDVHSILWLEDFLARERLALVMVTHDRLFLQRVATRIFDLDPRYPDGLLTSEGDYTQYLDLKASQLAAQEKEEDVFRNKLRRETEWLRRGAKARQTKQKARIDRAGDLSEATSEVAARNRERKVSLEFQDTDRKPKKMVELSGVSKSFGERTLFKNLDFILTPKTRVALLGANGGGKSTLLKIILGELEPSFGKVMRAEQLRPAYFEQHRDAFDPTMPLIRAVCSEGDYVEFQGRNVFARSYLSRFLFRSEQMDMPIGKLSGGEQSRLRIAQLMLEPSNLLILDEPTNDLDGATLDVLASTLAEFDGSVILVTHDRFFLDQVCNEILAFPNERSEPGVIHRFAGYEQWENWYRSLPEFPQVPTSTSKAATNVESAKPAKAKKINFKDKHDWETIESRIQVLESQLEKLKAESHDPALARDPKKLTDLFTKIGEEEAAIATLYARWADLEKIMT